MNVDGAVGSMFFEHPVVIKVSVNRDSAGAVHDEIGLDGAAFQGRRRPSRILNTEPGANCAWMALFMSGFMGSLMSCFHSLGSMRLAKSLGSNEGWLTIAKTSPVRGSRATTAPGCSPKEASAAICKSRSMVRRRSFPAYGVDGRQHPTSCPRLFTTTRRMPSWPERI